MKKTELPLLTLCAALAISACGGQGPVADNADDAAGLPAPETVNAADPSGAPPPPNAMTPAQRNTSGTEPSAAAAIPAALRGRWGMTPEDCTSTRGDAKGLLVIAPDRLSFYESRAVPVANVKTSSNSFSADFAFAGEGMTWTRFQSLRLEDGKLVRTDSKPMASYTYARCD